MKNTTTNTETNWSPYQPHPQIPLDRLESVNEYRELRAAGLADEQISAMRNTGATHAAILLWARRNVR
jgi:hypothetical protein